MTLSAPLQLSLGGIADIEPARGRLVAYLQRALGRIEPHVVYAVELVLEEWASNAFRHGGATRVAVEPDLRDAADIGLRFEDDGRPFDPVAAAAVRLPSSIDDAQPGGLGLHLMRQYVSEWRHERCDGRNRLSVKIRARA